jgi:hypothetical protein
VSCGLRDVLELEKAGKPSVLIASSAFVDAAVKQAQMLGQPNARRVFVEHPIQDRTDDELRELARSALPALEAHLGLGPEPAG